MKGPLRARYGARDNMHALLEWEGTEPLPADLLGLTDKPPGSYGPGERWWPSVGCGPVGGWWTLWWTEPDEQAQRAGMVRSSVAVWRLEEIGAVADLRPIMESLAGRDAILSPSKELLGAVAEALLPQNVRPPVLQDLDAWPGVIAALWARLWPEARRAFSARVAISPPQGGDSVAPPWIFGVPPERALQWSEYRVIAIPSDPVPLGRAARWLVGEADKVLQEVLVACPRLPADLGGLRRAARAAERLERLRTDPQPGHALDLLRTLVAVAPELEAAAMLKQEALEILVRGFTGVPPALVRSLANLKSFELPVEGALENALDAWTTRHAPHLPLEEVPEFLKLLSPDKAEPWWHRATHAALVKGMARLEPKWAKAALLWLGLPGAAEALRTLLPASDEAEKRLLGVTPDVEMSESALQQLRQQAAERRWSRLHAWAAMRGMPACEALQAQRALPSDQLAGLEFLVEHLPGAVVVEETVSSQDDRLIALLGRRTAREPELMRPLDARQPVWRTLWSAHVAAGGTPWPPGANREVLGRGLLEAILQGEEPQGLVAPLAEALADVALNHPKRATLWNALSSSGRAALLPYVASAIVKLMDTGQPVPFPEPPLVEAVVNKARNFQLSPQALAALLNWNVWLDEHEVIHWILRPKSVEWAPAAATLGQALHARRWKHAADRLYELSKRFPELRPAVVACQELLSPWQRWLFSWREAGARSVETDIAPLIRRVAELGAELATDRLEYIWERAGGERRHLKSGGPPDVLWQHAAALAHRGALKGGLPALVRELKSDLPYSPELHELEEILSKRK